MGSLHATEHKSVLIIQSVGRDYRPWSEYAEQIRAELDRQSPWPLDVREQTLELTRSGNSNPEPSFVGYLDVLYADHRPDLIVTIGAPAAAFVQRYRDQLFPTAPLLITYIEQRRLKNLSLTQNDTVVAATVDYRSLFESFLKILPDTKTVAVVNGHSPNELFWRNEIQKELRPLENRIDIRWYDNLSFQEILKQTASLPPHSAIYWSTMAVDAMGVPFEGDRALSTLHATANSPIFTYDHAFFGGGAVGGPMLSALVLGKKAGSIAVRLLGGDKADSIKLEPIGLATPQYDWRELQRWGIKESRLPQGSEIYFREQSAWEKYRWQFALVCAVILLQGGLISGLLLERRRRIHFEVQASRRSAELAHSNRYSMAGELTASIAHELNQPLGAILTNTETAALLLNSSTPNLDELREIISDIQRDNLRASDVVRHLRGMLKKAPPEMRTVDLNEIVRDTIVLLAPLAAARQVSVDSIVIPALLPIRGDRVLLQQIIVNLVVNAMDALSGAPRANRMVTISTSRGDDFALLSVSDTGPGIDVDKLKSVFEPFFTTKPKGMGMGLSIARTIVETHEGRMWAENRPGGGASFYVELPLIP